MNLKRDIFCSSPFSVSYYMVYLWLILITLLTSGKQMNGTVRKKIHTHTHKKNVITCSRDLTRCGVYTGFSIVWGHCKSCGEGLGVVGCCSV